MTFNSSEYTYCDMEVIILGRTIGGLRGIEYSSKKAKEVLYGTGRKGRGIQHGKREYEGTLTITQSELAALNRAAQMIGKEDCLDLDFDIIVTYTSPELIVTIDRIVCASITDMKSALKEGDMKMEISLPFVALDVIPNLV